MTEMDWQRIKYFKRQEFKHPELMKPELLYQLDLQRAALGLPFILTSDARPEKENQEAGGVSNSLHISGEAVDVKCPQIHPLDFFLFSCKYLWTEIGLYEIGILHLGLSLNLNRKIKRFFGFQCPAASGGNHPPKDSCPLCKGIGKIYRPITKDILVWYLQDQPVKSKNELLGIN